MDSNELIHNLRNLLNTEISKLILKNGHWSVKDKVNTFQHVSSRLFDSHLDLIKSSAINILSEKHPMFDLNLGDRFSAAIHGKKSTYSDDLRKGISETLAIIGTHGNKLKNCTLHKPEYTVVITIREIFKDADWKLWASLNDVLPILAEASPEEFLNSVDKSLKQTPSPFDELFRQEGNGITGGNYMTGLYWALESLSWSDEYLARTILIFAELATHDPGGNCANRPGNSISTILMPWFPQTTASLEKRLSTLKEVQRNYPEIAWKTLLQLLPNSQQISSGSHKPSFRKFIPDDWVKEVPTTEYWHQVKEYASMAVDMAKGNTQFVSKLVNNLDNLPQPVLEDFLDYLSSQEITGLSDEIKQPIWETLTAFIRKHRRYSDAEWALPTEMVNSLEKTAAKLTPSNPERLYRHLFSNKDIDFLEKDLDWNTQQEKLQSQRNDAIRIIYSLKGLESVINLADNVENPYKVGFSLSQIADNPNDKYLLPSYLTYQEPNKKQFISGYVSGSYFKGGLGWLDNLCISSWENPQICNLFLLLPFEEDIWSRVEKLLGAEAQNYWKNIIVNPFSTQSNQITAIDRLLKYNRPRLAIECIYAHFFTQKKFFKDRAIRALLEGVTSEETAGGMDSYHVTEIIKMLQDDKDINEDELFRIEWAYLPLLDRYNKAEPKLLEKYLSTKPEFFVEIIQLMYRSKKEENTEIKIDENKQTLAKNAWKLLHDWKRPPGLRDECSYSSADLLKWLNKVKEMCTESGHLEVALIHLGHVLFYTPTDPNGLWIHKAAAEVLNEKDSPKIRQGFSIECYNSRGVHYVDPTGKTELELAELWRQRANAVENEGYIHFASTLKGIAQSYVREAEQIIADYNSEINQDIDVEDITE